MGIGTNGVGGFPKMADIRQRVATSYLSRYTSCRKNKIRAYLQLRKNCGVTYGRLKLRPNLSIFYGRHSLELWRSRNDSKHVESLLMPHVLHVALLWKRYAMFFLVVRQQSDHGNSRDHRQQSDPAGFSPNSVFLNLHHLVLCGKNRSIPLQTRLAFPWIIWHIWKARNKLVFEQTRYAPIEICSKALDEADLWVRIDSSDPRSYAQGNPHIAPSLIWKKPPPNMQKSNIGVSWVGPNRNCGVSWILRDSNGNTLIHGRRSFSFIPSLVVAELLAIHWEVESLKNLHMTNVIFESSLSLAKEALLHPQSHMFCHDLLDDIMEFLSVIGSWSLNYVRPDSNVSANAIAVSFT